MNWKKWLLPAALMTAGATAGAVSAVENALVNAVIAVAAIGIASTVAQAWKGLMRVWLLVAAVSIAAGVTALITYRAYENACVATNASEERVVIGTELTDEGKIYTTDNPAADNKELLESLAEKSVDKMWTRESIERCRRALAISGAIWVPLLGIAVVAASSALRSGRTDSAAAPRPSRPRVFVSYSHDDTDTASKLKALLLQHKVDVIIDADNMSPGERITAFIDRSIRDCDVLLSLISSRSLVSPWVASEAIAALARNRSGREVTLIACYLDDDWLRPEFRLECTSQIDERLRRIEGLLAEYSAKKIDPADLNDEQSRLYNLRNRLGEILGRLKDSLSLDVREGQFDASAKRLVSAILAAYAKSV